VGQMHPVPMHVPRVSTDVGNEQNCAPDGHDFAILVA
jgi:hypothetical protein